jgi:hypothetical protein
MAAFFRPQWQDHWKNAPTAEQHTMSDNAK